MSASEYGLKKNVRFPELRGSGFVRLKIEKMYDRDFGTDKNLRYREDSGLMKVQRRFHSIFNKEKKPKHTL